MKKFVKNIYLFGERFIICFFCFQNFKDASFGLEFIFVKWSIAVVISLFFWTFEINFKLFLNRQAMSMGKK